MFPDQVDRFTRNSLYRGSLTQRNPVAKAKTRAACAVWPHPTVLGAVKISIPKLHKCHLEKKKVLQQNWHSMLTDFLCEKIDSTVIVNFTLSWEIYSHEAKFEFVLLCLSVSEKTNNILKKCCPPTRWGLVFGLGCLFFNFILWLLQLPG